MNFLFKYTKSNIRANKLRAILLIACIAFASILFFLSLAFPLYLRNYHEGVMRSFFGTSDIYMEATTNSLSTKDSIPTEISDNFEYMYGFVALPGVSKFSPTTDKSEPLTYVAGDINDVQDFNPVTVLQGTINNFSGRVAIVTKTAAETFGWKVGDNFRANITNIMDAQFKVVAIVANEGLLSTDNEKSGPIVFLAKDGVYDFVRNSLSEGGSLSNEEIDNYFNLAVVKVKNGVDILSIHSALVELFPEFKIEETVNEKVLTRSVGYLRIPLTVCIYLVCAFCALIIYLTCKLTFAERVRQFATLKSMGATSKGLFYSLLLESAFYGLIGAVFGISFALLQVYLLPKIFSSMMYVVSVPVWFYPLTILFGVGLAIGSSFVQALRNTRKSIKETMTKQEKLQVQNKKVSIIALTSFIVFATVMLCTLQISTKILSLPTFIITLLSIIIALPFIIYLAFWVYKKINRKQSFEHLYMKNTLPSKNLSVANRLLFFGSFLVLLFSGLIASLNQISIKGQETPYHLQISQANALNVTQEDLQAMNNLDEVDVAWAGVKLMEVTITEQDLPVQCFYGFNMEDIDRIYSSKVNNYDSIRNKLADGSGIILNKFLRDAKGFKLGDTFTLAHGTTDIEYIAFEVVGFINDYAEYGNYGVVTLNSLSSLQDINGFNSIFVNASLDYDVNETIAAIRSLSFLNPEDPSVKPPFLTFINSIKQQEIVMNQMKTPFVILRTYALLVLVLCMLCVFVGYVLYLKESSEYHKTMFALGLSTNRFQTLIIRQTIFTGICAILCAFAMSLLLFLQFENIFNALGTAFTLHINWLETSLYALGIFAGSLLLATALGQHFKRDLSRNIKRLFG